MAFVKNLFFLLLIVIAVLLLAPAGIPPHHLKFGGIEITRTPFEGTLKPNNKLDDFETLTREVTGTRFGYLKGPEAYAVKDGYLYTGIMGGDIIRLNLNSKTDTWHLVYRHSDSPCAHQYEEELCGRPLGMRFDSQGKLVVADAVFGLYRVDVEKGTGELLVSPEVEVEGKKSILLNSVAVGKDAYYYTVASTRHKLSEGLLELLSVGSPSGRVMKYDPVKKQSSVLMEALSFANGIALSREEDFLIVSDLGRKRILKYGLKGAGKGVITTFADTPGLVDNLCEKREGQKGFLAAVVTPLPVGGKFELLADLVMPTPILHRFLARIAFLANNVVQFVNEQFPSSSGDSVHYWMNNLELYNSPSYGLIVEYDEEGRLVKSWHSPTGKIAGLSEAHLSGGYLYLGSPWNQFAARIKYD